MRVGIVDVETTTNNKGNPFDATNLLVTVGIKVLNEDAVIYDKWDDDLREALNSLDVIVGHNIKFDLHWLRRVGYILHNKTIWDTMVGEFILSNQKDRVASLDSTLDKYGLPPKLDVVKIEYWEKGIDTIEIPRHILDDYLLRDLQATEEVYYRQTGLFNTEHKGKYPLFKLHNLDLLELHEMEWNGVRFNTTKAKEHVNEIEKETSTLVDSLTVFTNNTPVNFNSDDHVSSLIYGGTITEDVRIPIGVFKTGVKVGQTRYKIVVKEYELPQIIKPLPKTGRFKKGDDPDNPRYWLTNEKVISRLRPSKQGRELLRLLKEYTRLEKLKNTYLIGWSNKIDEMNWDRDMLHGNLNQCIVITGRLSGTNPNLQNPDPITKLFCESRYV